jgi:hypothetical protein
MALASVRGPAGLLARVGETELVLLELPAKLAPPRGGFALVLEAEAGSVHFPGDLYRIEEGCALDATGIVRALSFSSPDAPPDAVPPSWNAIPARPFPVFEDQEAGTLPHSIGRLSIEEVSAGAVRVKIDDLASEVPRHWVTRMLYRVAIHGLRMGYAETYGGFFVDDRGDSVEVGLREGARRAAIAIPRGQALKTVERLYRAVAPAGYKECPD